MAKSISPQSYPRIQDEEDKFHGFLNESALTEHAGKIDVQEVKAIIAQAIRQANAKSSRQILNIPPDASEADIQKLYEREGKKLFDYFMKYYGDPASTAFECEGLHYSDVAREQYRRFVSHKNRQNADVRNKLISRNPILAKLSCEEEAKLIYEVLDAMGTSSKISITDEIIEAFGKVCKKHQLLDSGGYFNDSTRLLSLFCS